MFTVFLGINQNESVTFVSSAVKFWCNNANSCHHFRLVYLCVYFYYSGFWVYSVLFLSVIAFSLYSQFTYATLYKADYINVFFVILKSR